MGYPEELLAPDEQLLLHRHPHWKMLFWPAVTFVVATAIAGFAGGVAWPHLEGTTRNAVLIVIVVLWAVIVLWRGLGRVMHWKSTHFIVTDRRVMVREGVFTHTGIDIPLNRITSVQFRNGLSDRLLGTGTLIIESASGEPLEYDDIPDVMQVHNLLYHEVFEQDRYDPRYDRPPGSGHQHGS
jgi:uncharacterized membrane protein YdbT with pleckstrin-like domain